MLARLTSRKRVVARPSREEAQRPIQHAYHMGGVRGLLLKTLFQTGARVSEFVSITIEDFFFDEQIMVIAHAKGGKSRCVRILPELAQELKTYLGTRHAGDLFETTHHHRYSPRRIQQMVKEAAAEAKITERCIRTSRAIRLRKRSSTAACPWSRSRSSWDMQSLRRHRSTPNPRRRPSRRATGRHSAGECSRDRCCIE
jgi:integrase